MTALLGEARILPQSCRALQALKAEGYFPIRVEFSLVANSGARLKRKATVSELAKIILTACATLIGGVLLMVATQIVTRCIVDPLVEFRRLIGEVAYTLILHSEWLFNASATGDRPEFQQAKDDCRRLASRLHSLSAAVPLYGLFVDLGAVPERSKVDEAASALIGLSNTRADTPAQVTQQRYDTISTALRIRVD